MPSLPFPLQRTPHQHCARLIRDPRIIQLVPPDKPHLDTCPEKGEHVLAVPSA